MHSIMQALIISSFGFLAMPAMGHEVDLTNLPLGDGKISTEPKQGWIWACHIESGGGGAFNPGPWIKNDGTYDLTAKPSVSGAVTWPSNFSITRKGNFRLIVMNDYPEHPTGIFPIASADPAYQYDRNPNSIKEQSMSVSLPAEPTLLDNPYCAPGAVGILLSGTVLFNALDAPGRDAVAHEIQDSCQGHPQQSGVYHYHNVSSCVPDQPDESGHSQLVGYALDGFGIYGHKGEGGKDLTSADLDECHGHIHEIIWDGKKVNMFHYHATWDFPYSVGCFRGTYSMRDVMTISGPRPGRNGPPGPGGPGGMGGPGGGPWSPPPR